MWRFLWLRPLTSACTELEAFARQVAGCTSCRLAQGRTQVVFGIGDPNADLMFVGEAPGFHEDKQGYPFVGQAGKLLDKLLAGIGLDARERLHRERAQVPPAREPRPVPGRDPGLRGHLFRQIELIRAARRRDARQLRDEAALRQANRDHARPRPAEQEVTLGGSCVLLYPLYHPAAALYTPAMLKVLEEDFARLPELLGRPVEAPAPAVPLLAPVGAAEPAAVQLGLF